ncbi:MAG: HAD family hydrolase [Anaerolineales bacterium]|nr:HAD family hydrolase [Anaerolineales bacterium]
MYTSNKIKAVLFDLDGTLRHHLPSAGEVFLEHIRSLGLKISEEDHIRAEHWVHFYFAHSFEIQADIKTHGYDKKEFWVNFTRRQLIASGIGPAQAATLAPQISAYMGESYRPQTHVHEEAHTVLQFLKDSGYVLATVSNRDDPYHEEMKTLKLDSYFQFFLAGGEINSFKPDALIFKHALELAGTSAQETMYVGDNYFADIVGSRRAGLMPVLYDPIRLFPDADCATIKSLAEIPILLQSAA